MEVFDAIVSQKDIPTDREFYENVNKMLEELGLPKLIITPYAVYRDEWHAYIGIEGIKLEGS